MKNPAKIQIMLQRGAAGALPWEDRDLEGAEGGRRWEGSWTVGQA